MTESNLNQSQDLYEGPGLENQINNNTIIDEDTSVIHSQSEVEEQPSRIDLPNDEHHQNDSNDKESLHIQISWEKVFENKEVKQRKQNSALKSLLRERGKEGLTFICFGEKKVELTRDEVQSFLLRKFGEEGSRRDVQGRTLIEEVIRKLCQNQLGFDPCLIRIETFNLHALETEGEEKRLILANNWQLQRLYTCDSLMVSRVQRKMQLSKYYQQMQQRSKDHEILEILSPDQRDLIEVIERGRTYGELKEKLLTYYYQMVGRIVLVTYHTFKKVQGKSKIGDLQERVLELYQDKSWDYQDKIFRKRSNPAASLTDCPHIYAVEDPGPPTTDELMANESLIWGSLYLQVRKNQLYQRYHGGLLGYLTSDRLTCRSLLTLTALKIVESRLYLQFKYKKTAQVVIYDFSSASVLTQLIKAVLTVVRIYNHRLQVME